MIRYSFIILLITLSNVACKKKEIDPSLVIPPYSETGVGTFACKVDGEVFNPAYAPDRSDGTPGGISVHPGRAVLYTYNNSLIFGGGIYDDRSTIKLVSIELNKIYDTGIYYILEEGDKNKALYRNGGAWYFTGGKYGGEVHIKRFDTTARIVSGTFWFDGIEDDGTVKHITEGVFDVKIDGIIRK